MTAARKRKKKAPAPEPVKKQTRARTSPAEPAPPPAPQRSLGRALLPFGLVLFGGVLRFTGFAGLDVWPLAFVCFIPYFAAIEMEMRAGVRMRRLLAIALLYGFVSYTGGFYWLLEMLKSFSGFGLALNLLFASLLWLGEGVQDVLFTWLFVRARRNGWPITAAAVLIFAAKELLFPELFPNYYANSFHMLPAFIQIADLGGPILVGMVGMAVNGALYEIGRARVLREPFPKAAPIAAVAAVALTLVYGFVRIGQVDALAAEAPSLRVGLVQTNMGIFQKRSDPVEGQRRHIVDTMELLAEQPIDLVVWPESAFSRAIAPRIRNLRPYVNTMRYRGETLGPIEAPLLFGGIRIEEDGDRERHFNSAILLDAEGNVLDTSDKKFLLMFGEYLPFGERFPILYDWSPHSGRFTPGEQPRPLRLGRHRILPLICYEDVIPRYTRAAVADTNPHLIVNITNDAWFGDTTEPWIHLALAKFRAVEHHRYLVRSTNSGVSAVVDPVGRVVTHSGVMTREVLHAEVRLMTGHSIYERLGDWPAYIAIAATLLFAFVPLARLRRRQKDGGKSSK